MTDSFRIKYENMNKPNDALETIKTFAFASTPN